MGHAKAILQVPESQRRMLRDQIVRSALSVRAAEELARRMSGDAARPARPAPSRDPHVSDLEDRLRRDLKTKVRIVGRPGRGRIELHYFRQEDLDRLSDLLVGGL